MTSYNINLYVRIKKKIKTISNNFENTQEVQNDITEEDYELDNDDTDDDMPELIENIETDDAIPIYMKKTIKNTEYIETIENKNSNKDIMEQDYEIDIEETDDYMPELIEDLEKDNNKDRKRNNVENRSRHLFSNYDKSFIKAANKVCSPSVLSRVSKSYRHASAKGIRTVFDDFMYGQDIINVVNEMRKIISSDNTEICG
ncbi:hypothetical protein BDF21DRAFT_398920 [Thamnidium elegans]|nr:hypothetical protein BDF21DRAFT_398920 [Thamnidium elegans]